MFPHKRRKGTRPFPRTNIPTYVWLHIAHGVFVLPQFQVFFPVSSVNKQVSLCAGWSYFPLIENLRSSSLSSDPTNLIPPRDTTNLIQSLSPEVSLFVIMAATFQGQQRVLIDVAVGLQLAVLKRCQDEVCSWSFESEANTGLAA